MKYEVWHRTTYTYDAAVNNSYGEAWVVPRSTAGQQVLNHRVLVMPQPSDESIGEDYFGNAVVYFQVREPHTELVVHAESTVHVEPAVYDSAALATPWDQVRPSWSASEFALPSELVEFNTRARDFAASSLTPGRPIGEAITDLMGRIHSEFDYDKKATTVTSSVDDVLDSRAGVCQDFAHLTIACLRAHGLATRYVSGYLATTPAPGSERIVGADASHAWTAVWLPDDTWLAFDPTNNVWADERYVTVAWGRDYRDVTPVRGIIFTDAKTSELCVQVDVAPVG